MVPERGSPTTTSTGPVSVVIAGDCAATRWSRVDKARSRCMCSASRPRPLSAGVAATDSHNRSRPASKVAGSSSSMPALQTCGSLGLLAQGVGRDGRGHAEGLRRPTGTVDRTSGEWRTAWHVGTYPLTGGIAAVGWHQARCGRARIGYRTSPSTRRPWCQLS